MQNAAEWKPTLLWHAKLLGALFVACTAAYFTLAFVLARLPEPYQSRQPAPQTTPWLAPNR